MIVIKVIQDIHIKLMHQDMIIKNQSKLFLQVQDNVNQNNYKQFLLFDYFVNNNFVILGIYFQLLF